MHVGMDGDQTKAKLRIRKSAMPRGCGAATPGVSGTQDTMGHYRLAARHARHLLTH